MVSFRMPACGGLKEKMRPYIHRETGNIQKHHHNWQKFIKEQTEIKIETYIKILPKYIYKQVERSLS